MVLLPFFFWGGFASSIRQKVEDKFRKVEGWGKKMTRPTPLVTADLDLKFLLDTSTSM